MKEVVWGDSGDQSPDWTVPDGKPGCSNLGPGSHQKPLDLRPPLWQHYINQSTNTTCHTFMYPKSFSNQEEKTQT